jgi:hypothetical protein
MSALNFPLNPINGQQYPDPAIPGVSVYRYDASANTWRLIGRAGYAVAGTYGDNTTCVEITIDAAGIIEQIYNRPITRTANTVYGINRPGIGLNVTTGNEGTVDLIPPFGSNIGGVKSGLNISISTDGTISVASATITNPGVVQLNNTTASSSITQALTAAAGKALQDQINALIVDALVFCGTYNASTSQMDYVTNEGIVKGFIVGQNVPAPSDALNGAFVIVSTPGTPVAPAPTQPVGSGDWIVCDSPPAQWVVIPIGRFIVASQVIFNPYNYVTATDVQTAIQEVINRTNYFRLTTGTGLSGGPFTLAGGSQTINLLPPAGIDIGGVKAGTNVIIAADGTISAVAGGTVGTVSQVNSGTGLTGGPITGIGTLLIADTGVIAGNYNYPTLTVNAQGQLTAVSSNTAVSSFTTGVGLSTTGNTGSITVNLLPPTGGNIGGVKAGTTVSIAADGTLEVVTGGAVGTISGVTAGNGLTGGGVAGVVTLDVGAGTGITVGADSIYLTDTGVTVGSYTLGNFTVNAQGQITTASSTAPSSVAVTTVTAGNGLTGGGGPGPVTLDVVAGTGLTAAADSVYITDTGVTAGSYSNADITVNAQGQITTAANGAEQAYHFTTLDNIAGDFNGTTTTFSLTIASAPYTPLPTSNIMVFIGGVIQIPGAAYNINLDQIIFTEAPAAGATFYATTVSNKVVA